MIDVGGTSSLQAAPVLDWKMVLDHKRKTDEHEPASSVPP